MDGASLSASLAHLEAAEHLLEQAGDLASLGRIALVIDMLRRENGMPDRAISEDDILDALLVR